MTSLAEQLACARRELALRRRVYPTWVNNGRLSPEKAHHETQAMASIVLSLEKLKLLEEVSEEMKAAYRKAP